MSDNSHRRQRFWQIVVVVICFICYGLNYFTRDDIYVTTDSFKEYLNPNNPDNAQKWLAIMYTLGSVGFLFSKLLFSIFIDTTINSGVKPAAFGFIMVPILSIIMAVINIKQETLRILICIILWFLIKACNAPQWAGIIKIISNWIDYKHYGRVMSIMSLSFLIGDAFARFIFGYILMFDKFNHHWRTIFYFGSFITLIAVIPFILLVKDSPIQRGLNLPQQNPENVYSDTKKRKEIKSDNKYISVQSELSENIESNIMHQQNKEKSKLWILLKPILIEPMFYFILLLNMELTFLREYFNMYSAPYLISIGASNSTAVIISALFPLMGIISSPLHGLWIDRMLRENKKTARYLLFTIQGIMILFAMFIFCVHHNIELQFAVLLILISGFSILGCYTMIYVLSLDLGGQTSPTIVSGIADCFGLFGSMLCSLLSGFGDYHFMFLILLIVSIINVITTICLMVYIKRKSSMDLKNVISDSLTDEKL